MSDIDEDDIREWIQMIVLSDNFEEEELDFIEISNFTIQNFTKDNIDIRINFKHPEKLSKNILVPEVLKIYILGKLKAEDYTKLSNYTIIFTEIPQ